jgi:hypothetical protein
MAQVVYLGKSYPDSTAAEGILIGCVLGEQSTFDAEIYLCVSAIRNHPTPRLIAIWSGQWLSFRSFFPASGGLGPPFPHPLACSAWQPIKVNIAHTFYSINGYCLSYGHFDNSDVDLVG